MALININQNGGYPIDPANAYIAGVGYSFTLSGTNWKVSIIDNSGAGPNKYFLVCDNADGNAIDEILKGNPPNGLANGQGQDQPMWVSGNEGNANVSQIDYIIDTSNRIFKIVSVLDNNKIEVADSQDYGDTDPIDTPMAYYTKGIQLDEITTNIQPGSGDIINLNMTSYNGKTTQVYESKTLSFTEGSGPVVITTAGAVVYSAISFKKSLERLS